MAAGTTYEPLATASPTSGTSYTFSGWTGTYTDYVISGAILMTANTTIRMRLNGDTSSNYYYSLIYANGTNTYTSGTALELMDCYSGVRNSFVANIMNADGTTLANKCVLTWGGMLNGSMMGGGWQSNSAITSVTILTTNGSQFASQGSKLTLYGIRRA
jgi:hypothetical protein